MCAHTIIRHPRCEQYAQIGDFAEEYFKLFKNGDRPDLGDRGAEYRSLIGLPGGAYLCAQACSNMSASQLDLTAVCDDPAEAYITRYTLPTESQVLLALTFKLSRV